MAWAGGNGPAPPRASAFSLPLCACAAGPRRGAATAHVRAGRRAPFPAAPPVGHRRGLFPFPRPRFAPAGHRPRRAPRRRAEQGSPSSGEALPRHVGGVAPVPQPAAGCPRGRLTGLPQRDRRARRPGGTPPLAALPSHPRRRNGRLGGAVRRGAVLALCRRPRVSAGSGLGSSGGPAAGGVLVTSAARRAPGGSRRGGAWRERRRIYALGAGPGRAAGAAAAAGGGGWSTMVSGAARGAAGAEREGRGSLCSADGRWLGAEAAPLCLGYGERLGDVWSGAGGGRAVGLCGEHPLSQSPALPLLGAASHRHPRASRWLFSLLAAFPLGSRASRCVSRPAPGVGCGFVGIGRCLPASPAGALRTGRLPGCGLPRLIVTESYNR